MTFDISFEDDEVPRDAPGQASVRFWDDAPGAASGERMIVRWDGRNLQTEVLVGRVEPSNVLGLDEAVVWLDEAEELTLGDLWLRWWT